MAELVASYTLTLQDYRQLMAVACSPLRSPYPKWTRPALIALWLAAVTFFVFAYRARGEPWLLFLATMLPISFSAIMQAATRVRLRPRPDGAALGQRTLTVHDQGYEVTARDWEVKMRWEAITDVVETPTHVPLMMDASTGTVIPKHALPSADALRPYLPDRLRSG